MLFFSNDVKGFAFVIKLGLLFVASVAFDSAEEIVVLATATDPSSFGEIELRLKLVSIC